MLLEEREDRARQLSDELARAKADIEDFAKESERALLASRDKFQAEVDRLREELREVRGKLKEAREGLRLEKQQRSAEGNALQ
jgi:predicted  nucleic acid-binding Zn-ribbon protein